MATSADKIKTAVLGYLQGAGFKTSAKHAWMEEFVDALSKGLYDELQNLDDKTGSPPSTGHQ